MKPRSLFLSPVARLGAGARAGFEQAVYSLTRVNAHFQDVTLEIERLGAFLTAHDVAVRSAIDVGCGDGAITVRLRDVLGLDAIAGVELNARLSRHARSRGVEVFEEDMEIMPIAKTYDIVISYGSLHHSPAPRLFVERLRRLANRYVLIVDNTVRATPFHRLTGSAWFPLELSPYPIRSVRDIQACIRDDLSLVATQTFRHANIWHDRSFILAAVV
jgi:hypothetical protein